MHLVQILLPVSDNQGQAFSEELFEEVQSELIERFGGVTAHVGAPAEGLWADGRGRLALDRIVVFEVMVEAVDAAFWREYRTELETLFSQDEIVVRAIPIARL